MRRPVTLASNCWQHGFFFIEPPWFAPELMRRVPQVAHEFQLKNQ
jgi:hypothetical protein